MAELTERDLQFDARRSTKGNQLKWRRGDIWYKADYTGYEGLVEYVVSALLAHSDLPPEYVLPCRTVEIRYGQQVFRGCESRHFLPAGAQLLTLERMYRAAYGGHLYTALMRISEIRDRLAYLTEMTERLTGLTGAGRYYGKMLTIDALFLNEDRHLHNVAFIENADGSYSFCPIFDNGAGLLADTTMDYPVGGDVYEMLGTVRAKTLSDDFEEQLDAAEALYGDQLRFCFGEKEINQILRDEQYYDVEIKQRVKMILLEQRRRYGYLFV